MIDQRTVKRTVRLTSSKPREAHLKLVGWRHRWNPCACCRPHWVFFTYNDWRNEGEKLLKGGCMHTIVPPELALLYQC